MPSSARALLLARALALVTKALLAPDSVDPPHDVRDPLQPRRNLPFAPLRPPSSATRLPPVHRGLDTQRSVCNLFRQAGLLVEDNITVKIPRSGIVEQIDGVVELDGRRYLLEVRDHARPMSAERLAWPLDKARSRAGVGLIVVSAGGYTRPAIEYCRGALQELAVVLVHLDELVALRDPEGELPDLLRVKVRTAELHRDPYWRADGRPGPGS